MPHLLDQPSIAGINPMIPQPFRVRRRRQENADTFTLEIEPTGIANPFAFSPGQFNMLYVFGVGEVPISICGHSEGRHTIAHTTRAVGTVTRAMAKLKRGELLGVRGPFGSSWPTEAAVGRDVVLVAGGIGLAPLRPVIDHLLRRRRKTGCDLGPAIPAADATLSEANLDGVLKLLTDSLERGVHEHFERARLAEDFDKNDLDAGRNFVKAYVEYIHCVEALYRQATSPVHGHYREAEQAAHDHEK
jgi:NAD(P)H-flavin reductase